MFQAPLYFDFNSMLMEKRKKMKGKSRLSDDSKVPLDCFYSIIFLCGNHEDGVNCFLIIFGETVESASDL